MLAERLDQIVAGDVERHRHDINLGHRDIIDTHPAQGAESGLRHHRHRCWMIVGREPGRTGRGAGEEGAEQPAKEASLAAFVGT